MRILVVNNYGQFNHLIVRSIRDFVESKLISNQTPPEEIEANGLILGGGPALERAGKCADYLKELDIPILGICLGLQLMGTTFGGTGSSRSRRRIRRGSGRRCQRERHPQGLAQDLQDLGIPRRSGRRAAKGFRDSSQIQRLRY